MNTRSFLNSSGRVPLLCRAAILLAMTCGGLAHCGEIHEAAKAGDLAKVKALLEANARLVETADSTGATALHLAAHCGNSDVVALLLEYGADPNAELHPNIPPPPRFPGSLSDKEMTDMLAANELRIRAQEMNGITPLHMAVQAGNLEAARLLITHKAHVNAKSKFGHTALHYAAATEYKSVAKLLLDNQAEINARDNQGNTPLHLACLNGQVGLVELLVTRGADPNAKNAKGQIPLDLAESTGHDDVAAVLRQGRNTRTETEGQSQRPASNNLWSQADITHSQELLSSLDAGVITRKHEILEAPLYYKGPVPFSYMDKAVYSPGTFNGLDIAIYHDFPHWRTTFIYTNRESALMSLPDGAQTIEKDTGRVLAETRNIALIKGQGIDIEERHYDVGGKLIFTCKSRISFVSKQKVLETDASGHKEQDYYFFFPAD